MKNFELEYQNLVDRIAKQLNDLAAGNVDEEDECQDLYDYFDEVYDIEYRIDDRGEYRSVKLMIACSGPTIYVDTGDAYVKLYRGAVPTLKRLFLIQLLMKSTIFIKICIYQLNKSRGATPFNNYIKRGNKYD